jgi:hypothetical protein
MIFFFHCCRQYLWVDEKGKKTRLSAPQYVDLLMTYVQKTINDESIFPTKHGEDISVENANTCDIFWLNMPICLPDFG